MAPFFIPFFYIYRNLNMETITNWTYADFLTYLLILGAQADFTMTEDEKSQIIQKVGEENFVRIKRVFDRQNDAQHIDMVTELYQKFHSEIGGKENLVKALRESFLLGKDGKEHVMDRYMLMMLKKIL